MFLEEAANSFRLYIVSSLLTYPSQVVAAWTAHFGPPENEEAWLRGALAELPALSNFVDLMVAASSQPTRKDRPNHFMDNEIMVTPLAYSDVFVARDKGIRDLLRNRTPDPRPHPM